MRFRSDRRVLGWAGAVITALGLAACGTAHSTTTSSTAATQSASATAATTATTTTSTSPRTASSTSTTTTVAGTPPGCRPDQLRLDAAGGGAATGHFVRRMMFVNTSGATCTMYGYPGLELTGADGRPMAAPVRRGGGFAFTDPGPHLVTLAAGASASFQFGGASVSQPSGQPCPPVSGVKVIPPNDYAQLTAPVQAVACPGQGVTVSAVSAGSGA